MYICVCKGITQTELEEAAQEGLSYADVRKQTGVATDCGSCARCVKSIIKEQQNSSSVFDLSLAKAI